MTVTTETTATGSTLVAAAGLREDYIERVNSALQEGREDLAWELARAYEREVSPAIQRTTTPLRRLLTRFDSYTLRVFNPTLPNGGGSAARRED